MFPRIPSVCASGPATLFAALTFFGATTSLAQSAGFNLELHANENVSAASMGLPTYPNARPFKDTKSDSAVDLGMSFGLFHFRVMASNYVTKDSPDQVLDFYRTPLSRYGDVLECEHGEAVGAIKVARSGLSCSDKRDHHSHIDVDERSHRELRSGTPTLFRIVAIDTKVRADTTRANADRADATHFALVLLEIPKDSGSH